MPKIVISTTNDISTDNRVNKVALLLQDLGYEVLWVGRKLPKSLALSRSYKTHRMKLWFTTGPFFYAEYNLRLFFFLFFAKADVLLSNDLDTLLANYLVSKIKNTELVYDTHEYFLGVPEIQNNKLAKSVWTKIEKWIFPKLKTVFTVNDSIANLYLKDYGIKPLVFRNISPIPKSNQTKTRKDLGLPQDKIIAINQGAGINVDRGMEEAFEALKLTDNVVLLIVGSGDVLPQLKAKAETDGLQDKVIFVDKVPYAELLEYTRNADFGLSLDKDTNINYKYSLPNKLFDYIHCGLPVLCSNVVEVKSIVEEFKIGISVKTHSPLEISEAMKLLARNGKHYYKEPLKKAAQNLNWEAESEVLQLYYRTLWKSL